MKYFFFSSFLFFTSGISWVHVEMTTTTTLYHPMWNGLTEKFNGTLKKMLRRLCIEQPKQWYRFINTILFAYREVPQASTGFLHFELLYNRSVRGPMTILKELWTGESEYKEFKTSYQYVSELRERLEETMQLASEKLTKNQFRYKGTTTRRQRIDCLVKATRF